jgi:hypothetical protein
MRRCRATRVPRLKSGKSRRVVEWSRVWRANLAVEARDGTKPSIEIAILLWFAREPRMSATPRLRSSRFIAAAAVAWACVAGCGGRSSLDGLGASSDGRLDAAARVDAGFDASPGLDAPPEGAVGADANGDGGECAPPTSGAWAITSSGLDTSCKDVAECQAVYLGDNVCEVPLNGGGNCPNAGISMAAYNATYLPEYEAINSACSRVCGPGSVLCPTLTLACNGTGSTATRTGAGTCEITSAVAFPSCAPSDGPAVTFVFAQTAACTSEGMASATADSITLYNVPSGPVMNVFAPTGPNGPGVAQSCHGGVCVAATHVIFALTSFEPGSASGSYEIQLANGTTDSGSFVATVCGNAATCG